MNVLNKQMLLHKNLICSKNNNVYLTYFFLQKVPTCQLKMAFDFLCVSLNEKSLLSTILSTFFAKLLFTFCKLMILLSTSGADPGFQVRGGALKKKLRRGEGGTNIFGVFRVKNHNFTPKNNIFSNCGGRRENCWCISCEKSRFYAKKSAFFQFQGRGGGGAPAAPPWICPCT